MNAAISPKKETILYCALVQQGYVGGDHTVSWRIRIFNCIEEVPRFFFSIEFNPSFQISNYLQFNCTPHTI